MVRLWETKWAETESGGAPLGQVGSGRTPRLVGGRFRRRRRVHDAKRFAASGSSGRSTNRKVGLPLRADRWVLENWEGSV